ncbi:MAG TPA: pseudouridine-5'-phosphate glycosidase [Pyrinomonadaceae bacterium]|nr:pseudouridine-5'-phosphate glycosidase [Pyrinomonadaceae bacterium]
MKLNFNDEVSGALHFERPIVALESTVIAHGLPYPKNIETARRMEQAVRDSGAVPATVGVFGGEIYAGLNDGQLELLAKSKDIHKLSRRDMPVAVAKKLNAATTVATTSFIAHAAGIKVFATGGIGGVHRGSGNDVSADLPELAQTPIIVVCSGAKIVLDLPATREWLETYGVTVLGWQCDELPAFYSRGSGLKIDQRVETPGEVAAIAAARNDLGMSSAVIVAVPVPAAAEVPSAEVEKLLAESLKAANQQGIKGSEVTPFLLSRLSERSNGKTLDANIALLENNARVAAEIACALNY